MENKGQNTHLCLYSFFFPVMQCFVLCLTYVKKLAFLGPIQRDQQHKYIPLSNILLNFVLASSLAQRVSGASAIVMIQRMAEICQCETTTTKNYLCNRISLLSRVAISPHTCLVSYSLYLICTRTLFFLAQFLYEQEINLAVIRKM